jgi:hypothetical protein
MFKRWLFWIPVWVVALSQSANATGLDSFSGLTIGAEAPSAGSEWTKDRGELYKPGVAFGIPNALIGARTCGGTKIVSISISWLWGDTKVSNPVLETVRQKNKHGAAVETARAVISALKKQGWEYKQLSKKEGLGSLQGFGVFSRGALQRSMAVSADPVGGSVVTINIGTDAACG